MADLSALIQAADIEGSDIRDRVTELYEEEVAAFAVVYEGVIAPGEIAPCDRASYHPPHQRSEYQLGLCPGVGPKGAIRAVSYFPVREKDRFHLIALKMRSNGPASLLIDVAAEKEPTSTVSWIAIDRFSFGPTGSPK